MSVKIRKFHPIPFLDTCIVTEDTVGLRQHHIHRYTAKFRLDRPAHKPGTAAMTKLRLIHIIDEDAEFRQSASSIFMTNNYCVLIHPSAASFFATLRALPPGIILLRLEGDGASMVILSRLLALNLTWPVAVMMSDGEDGMMFRTLRLATPDPTGAAAEPDLLHALRAVSESVAGRSTTPDAAESISARLQKLSAREREVLAKLAEGKTHKVIARDLGISPRTVEVHRANIMRKLRLQRSIDLVQAALAMDLAGPAVAEVANPESHRPATAA